MPKGEKEERRCAKSGCSEPPRDGGLYCSTHDPLKNREQDDWMTQLRVAREPDRGDGEPSVG